jgi:hypothetical protein
MEGIQYFSDQLELTHYTLFECGHELLLEFQKKLPEAERSYHDLVTGRR